MTRRGIATLATAVPVFFVGVPVRLDIGFLRDDIGMGFVVGVWVFRVVGFASC